MKQFKTLLAMVLALMMVIGTMGLALAAGEGSITVTEKKVAAGETTTTYEVYRIFDVVAAKDSSDQYLMDGENYASMTYTINTAWAGFFTGTAAGAKYIVDTNDTSANSGNGYTPIVVGGTVKYIALTDNNVATFGKEALAYSQTAPVAATASNTTGNFTGLDLGYYMVYPKGANINVSPYTSIVSLTTTDPSQEVVQKAEYPTLEKTDSDDSVEVGQTVTYTLTSKVPDTTGYDTFDFTMNDQMTAGLTFDGTDSITVKIDNDGTDVEIPATGTGAYTYASETAGEGFATAFKITIPVMSYQDYIGKKITVTYTATVNDSAVTKIDKNHATLTYSHDPKDNTKKTTTPPDEETVFSAKIVIDKVDGTNTSAKLADAKFILRCKSVADADSAAQAKVGKYYVYTAASGDTPATVTWVDEAAIDTKVAAGTNVAESDVTGGATIKTTNASGATSFDGLENGVYELIEVAAPAGYNQISGVAATVTVNGNNTSEASLTATQQIENNAGSVLPSTGGIGTTIFYIAGIVMVLGAAAIVIARRKAEQ